MLADPTHALAKDFEVYIEAEGVAERGSFILNPKGKIVAYEVTAGNVGRNADELFRRVVNDGEQVSFGKKNLAQLLDLLGR